MSEPVAALAAEALRLLAALAPPEQDAPEQDAPEQDAAGPHVVDDPAGEGTVPCTACPACRLLAALRATGPEVLDQLLDAAAGLLVALQAPAPPPPGPPRDARAAGPYGAPGAPPAPAPRLQPIPLDPDPPHPEHDDPEHDDPEHEEPAQR